MSVVGAALARSRHDDKNKAHQNVFCKPAHFSATDVGGYGIVSYGGAAGVWEGSWYTTAYRRLHLNSL